MIMHKIVVGENNVPKEENFDTIIVNTYFEIEDLNNISLIPENSKYVKETLNLIDNGIKLLKDGGVLFVYGLPKYLSIFGVHLNNLSNDSSNFLFKYWIGIEFNKSQKYDVLHNKHVGLLMYLKTSSLKFPTPFNLNTKTIREKYKNCAFCNKNIRDWGGKKHLMNPLGSAFSDVWDYTNINISECNNIPKKVIERIIALREKDNSNILIIRQNKIKVDVDYIQNRRLVPNTKEIPTEINEVYLGDCIEHLKKLKKEFPHGIFDLAFADPPYNLSKEYSNYEDSQLDKNYVVWCNEWLNAMYENLRPGGALIVLNIPKWSLYHANSLLNKMNFQHWIIWDALSTPAGKLLPAHYGLLYFTKPGGKITNNYESIKEVDHRKYCLRLSCVKNRKDKNDNEKENMGDVWKDIHRIKHRKDRDSHPCQLPIKLMDRIVKIFTNKGDLIYDPFGGAGTTAISAKKLGRNFILSELDPKYLVIINRNLSKLQPTLNGEFSYIRDPIKKSSKFLSIPKRTVEVRYLEICKENQKVLEKEEIKMLNPYVFSLLEQYNGSFVKLKNICQRKFEAESLIAK